MTYKPGHERQPTRNHSNTCLHKQSRVLIVSYLGVKNSRSINPIKNPQSALLSRPQAVCRAVCVRRQTHRTPATASSTHSGGGKIVYPLERSLGW